MICITFSKNVDGNNFLYSLQVKTNEARLLTELNEKRETFKTEVDSITTKLDSELTLMKTLRDSAKKAVQTGNTFMIVNLLPILQSRMPGRVDPKKLLQKIPELNIKFRPEFSSRLGDLEDLTQMNGVPDMGINSFPETVVNVEETQHCDRNVSPSQEQQHNLSGILEDCALRESQYKSKVHLKWSKDICGLVSDVAFLPSDLICVVDSQNNRLLSYDLTGQEVMTSANKVQLDEPWSLAFHPDLQGVIVSSRAPYSLKVLDAKHLTEMPGVGLEGVEWPCGLAVFPNGNLAVSEVWMRHGVSIHNKEGKWITSIGSGNRGNTPDTFNWPEYITIDKNNSILVSDSRNHCVKVYDTESGLQKCLTGSHDAALVSPRGLCVDEHNNIILVHGGVQTTHQVSMWCADGRFLGNLVVWDMALQRETGAMKAVACQNNHLIVVGEKCIFMYDYYL